MSAVILPPRALLEVYCQDRACIAHAVPRLVGLVRVGSGMYRHESAKESDCPVCGAPLGKFLELVTA